MCDTQRNIKFNKTAIVGLIRIWEKSLHTYKYVVVVSGWERRKKIVSSLGANHRPNVSYVNERKKKRRDIFLDFLSSCSLKLRLQRKQKGSALRARRVKWMEWRRKKKNKYEKKKVRGRRQALKKTEIEKLFYKWRCTSRDKRKGKYNS